MEFVPCQENVGRKHSKLGRGATFAIVGGDVENYKHLPGIIIKLFFLVKCMLLKLLG